MRDRGRSIAPIRRRQGVRGCGQPLILAADARLLPPGAPADTEADTLCVGLFEGEQAPADLDRALGGRLARLIESGEAKGSFKKIAMLHPDGAIGAARVIAVGLGKRDEFTPERARIAAAVGAGAGTRRRRQARRLGRSRRRSTRPPSGAALAEGALLAAYRFDRYKSGDDDNGAKGPEEVEIVSGEDLAAAIREADIVAEHQNAARDLQNLPSNDLTPVKLAEHALRRGSRDRGARRRRVRPRRDREAAPWAACCPSRRARTRSRASSCCATTAGAPGRCSRWSARRSPSTPAESRSSPRQRCRR